MYEVDKMILNAVLCFATIWNIYRYLKTFFETRKRSILSVISWIVLIGTQIFIEFRDEQGNIWTSLAIILTIFLFSINCFQKAGIKKFLLTVFLYVMWATIEVIVSAFLAVIPIDGRIKLTVGEILSKIIAVFIVQLIVIFNQKAETGIVPLKYNIFLLFVPIGSIYILLNQFLYMEHEKNPIYSMISYCIILIINIQIFEIYLKLIHFFAKENEKNIYENQLQFMSQKIEEQYRISDDLYRERHDVANELIVVKECVRCDDKKGALDVLDEIIESGGTRSDISNSGNRIVDALINFKYVTVKDLGIHFSLKIFIPDSLPIKQRDLGIVIGNALDNAIEATRSCKAEEKNINIIMGIKKGDLVLIVRNPYEGKLKISQRGEFLSTKKDSIGHGYGLNSIRRIAELYSGEVLIDTSDNIFTLTVVMNLQEFC